MGRFTGAKTGSISSRKRSNAWLRNCLVRSHGIHLKTNQQPRRSRGEEVEHMKAVVFDKVGGPEVLKIAEVPKPDVKPGMVLIKVRAAGINFADTLFRQGLYAWQPTFPATPGLEAAAVTHAVAGG